MPRKSTQIKKLKSSFKTLLTLAWVKNAYHVCWIPSYIHVEKLICMYQTKIVTFYPLCCWNSATLELSSFDARTELVNARSCWALMSLWCHVTLGGRVENIPKNKKSSLLPDWLDRLHRLFLVIVSLKETKRFYIMTWSPNAPMS